MYSTLEDEECMICSDSGDRAHRVGDGKNQID